jgi:hypothetical protein
LGVHLFEEVCMRLVFGFLASFASSVLLAQGVEIPVTNWTVPPYDRSSGGVNTMTDFTPPRVFVAVAPCRVVDTRNAPGAYGGPALATNFARTFDINNGPCPGIPAGVDAYSLNFGGIVPPADGFLTAWPTGSAQPSVSQLNFIGGEVVSNAAIVPAGTNGAINVLVNIGPTHVYIDINGYFSSTLGEPFNSFGLTANTTNAVAYFTNESSSCSYHCGVDAFIYSSSSGSAIVGSAIYAGNNSAGVRGVQGGPLVTATYPGAGVRGEGFLVGTVGISLEVGTAGSVVNGSGGVLAEGYVGYNPPGTSTNYGIWAAPNFGGSGAKYFVEPHPTDASKVIRYISLEGPEAGTYFRGRARFERGIARIRVPEDFRLVTDEEGLTVQITPIGGMATVGVLKLDLNEIVVQSSRNLEFSYTVNGVRRTHKNLGSPVGNGSEFMPRSADAKMPAYLTDEQKKSLVQNGTYRADGTVNLETARRLGWDRVWAERERPSTRPAP